MWLGISYFLVLSFESLSAFIIGLILGCFITAICFVVVLFIKNIKHKNKMSEIKRNETEIRETNKMMERLNKLRTDFLVNITHEFRTPLTIIRGYALLAADDIEEGEAGKDTADNLRHAAQEAKRLSDLASNLLHREVKTENSPEIKKLEMITIFEPTVATCCLITGKNNNSLNVYIQDGLPEVKANRDMIIQVLINLIANANRHTRNGIIELRAENGNRRTTQGKNIDLKFVTVAVSDNGTGIISELLPFVFERSVTGSSTDEQPGTGLGLSICKEIVESHGGEIGISKGLGDVGTQIWFTLPACEK